jgi:hypothetical protein
VVAQLFCAYDLLHEGSHPQLRTSGPPKVSMPTKESQMLRTFAVVLAGSPLVVFPTVQGIRDLLDHDGVAP